MAVAYDSVTPDTQSGAGTTELTSGSWTISGGDRLLIGIIATGDITGDDPTGMDHPAAGGALTQIGSTVSLGTHGKLSAWRRVAPATGANTTKGVWGTTQGEACIGGVSYTGVDQATPVGTPATATAAVTNSTAFTATVNVSTTVGETVFAAAFFHETDGSSSTSATPAGGSTGRYDIEGAQISGFGAMQCIELVATGTTTTMSVDFADGINRNGHWGIIAFVINASAAGSSNVLMGQVCT